MKAILAVLVAVAAIGCGTEDDHSDLHEAATCSGWVNRSDDTPLGVTKCERACATPPPETAFDPAKQCWPKAGSNPPIGGTTCQYFEFEGVKGCCEWDTGQPSSTGVMGFYECAD